jgi:hypothetical protein
MTEAPKPAPPSPNRRHFDRALVEGDIGDRMTMLSNMLRDRNEILHEVPPPFKTCEYGALYRNDIRTEIAVIRALRFALRCQEIPEILTRGESRRLEVVLLG